MRGSTHISTRSEMRVPMTVSTPSSSTMVPARNMSCEISERTRSGPDRRKAEHDRDDDAAGDEIRKEVRNSAGERVERGAHRIFQDDAALREALGARGHHVWPAQFVEQVSSHDTNELRGAAEREDHRGQRQMLEQVPRLGPAPRRKLEFGARTARPHWRRRNGTTDT